MLQSIHFDKRIWSLENSKRWLRSHYIIPIKPVHETKNWFMFRMSRPKMGNFYSKYITDGVLFIFD